MLLGIYHEPVCLREGHVETYGPYARYVLGMAQRFEAVRVFAPATDQPTQYAGVALDQANVEVVPLPYFETHAQAYRRMWAIMSAFRSHCRDLDAVLARGTAPLAYGLWLLTRRQRAPFVYHFASDPFEVMRNSPRYRGPLGLFAAAAYSAEFAIQKAIVRGNYAFTSGERLCSKLRRHTPNVEAVVTSSLRPEDYLQRADTCLTAPVRLLFVGALRHAKGIEYLLEALRLLREEGSDVILKIVGAGEHRQALDGCVEKLGLEAAVEFAGRAMMGEELNAHYASGDIFVLPSISEGSPKVVLEAMAHSLPVVSTDVGSVSEMLGGGRRGLLVPPRDPAAIARAVGRLLAERKLRQQLIRAGYEFSLQHGVDTFIDRIAAKIREMVRRRRGGEA